MAGAEATVPGAAAATSATPRPGPLLAVDDLTVEVRSPRGWVQVLDGVTLSIERGQTVGLVGESGCGKTLTSLAVMGLLDRHTCRVVRGSITLDGVELVGLDEHELARVRGRSMAMIFQEPRRSLHPAFTVGEQVAEVVRRHHGVSRSAARARAAELLDTVGIHNAARRAGSYPHELSGGMCQRVMLACALAGEPQLLIADEPTTALDVTVQAQVLRLMEELQDQLGLSVLLITHDLGVVAEMCDLIAVMYAGQVTEVAPLYDLFERPQHPYTRGLLDAIPTRSRRTRMSSIAGVVPMPWAWPQGCRFHPRCPFAQEGRCDSAPVLLRPTDRGLVRCVRHDEIAP